MVLPPALVPAPESLVVVVSSEGKLLAFPVADVPEMPRGKGNKLYDIPGKKAAAREELMTGVAVVPPRRLAAALGGREAEDARVERPQGVPRPARAARGRAAAGVAAESGSAGDGAAAGQGVRPPGARRRVFSARLSARLLPGR